MEYKTTFVNSQGVIEIAADGEFLRIVDNSNYDTNTELGHEQSDFSQFREIRIVKPDGRLVLFSSLPGAGLPLSVPSIEVLPIETAYAYGNKDGIYEVELVSVPTWKMGTNYDLDHCVYWSGMLWKSLGNTTLAPSDTNTTEWEAIDINSLTSRYKAKEKVAVTCSLLACYSKLLKSALCEVSSLHCTGNVCSSKEYQKALKIFLALQNITILVRSGDWKRVEVVFDFANSICCCHG